MNVSKAKMCLSLFWLVAIAPLLFILILRQLNGFYDDSKSDPREVWNWVSQFVLPGLTLIAGAWTVSASPSDEKPVAHQWVFWAAVGMSMFYVAVLYLVIGMQATSALPWPETFKQSALYLGLIQGALIAVLGKFFIEAAK
jgi:hypothetical protein